jgi:hypothetical protein
MLGNVCGLLRLEAGGYLADRRLLQPGSAIAKACCTQGTRDERYGGG